MGFLNELKKLARPYDDEDDEFEDFTPRAPEKIPVTPRTYSASLTIRVDYVSQPEDGECVAVFSTDKFLQNVTAVREATAEIVFGTLTGVSVPREAVHLNDKGETVVYILEGVRANEVGVHIIAETPDLYMVEETRGGLRVNDIIIVRAASLYDGAVVER